MVFFLTLSGFEGIVDASGVRGRPLVPSSSSIVCAMAWNDPPGSPGGSCPIFAWSAEASGVMPCAS